MKENWITILMITVMILVMGAIVGKLIAGDPPTTVPSNIEAFKCKDGSYHALVKQEDQSRNWVKLPVTCKGDE